MEFRFNLNDIFNTTISKINYTLLPSNFSGESSQCAAQVAEVIDKMGVASAKAQDLHHPITSSEKLRHCDHILYLMIDPDDNECKGSAVGFLKVGDKQLFLTDKTGKVHEKKAPCILDFYVHESKQRTGHGKELYDYMLKDRNLPPHKLAIDGPIETFLAFVYKHYGLAKIYPQTNNFVLFEGFFSETNDNGYQVDLPDGQFKKGNSNGYDNHSVQSYGYTQTLHGRHTAHKPEDTMGKCFGGKQPSPEKSSRHFVQTQTQHTTLW